MNAIMSLFVVFSVVVCVSAQDQKVDTDTPHSIHYVENKDAQVLLPPFLTPEDTQLCSKILGDFPPENISLIAQHKTVFFPCFLSSNEYPPCLEALVGCPPENISLIAQNGPILLPQFFSSDLITQYTDVFQFLRDSEYESECSRTPLPLLSGDIRTDVLNAYINLIFAPWNHLKRLRILANEEPEFINLITQQAHILLPQSLGDETHRRSLKALSNFSLLKNISLVAEHASVLLPQSLTGRNHESALKTLSTFSPEGILLVVEHALLPPSLSSKDHLTRLEILSVLSPKAIETLVQRAPPSLEKILDFQNHPRYLKKLLINLSPESLSIIDKHAHVLLPSSLYNWDHLACLKILFNLPSEDIALIAERAGALLPPSLSSKDHLACLEVLADLLPMDIALIAEHAHTLLPRSLSSEDRLACLEILADLPSEEIALIAEHADTLLPLSLSSKDHLTRLEALADLPSEEIALIAEHKNE